MIAVSGSGIAGLAAALAVLRNQKPLLLVAGRTPATTLQGGVQIAPNGWAALDQLGLGDAARARATALQAITVRDMRSAATLASLDLSASPYASLSRADLASLLKSRNQRLERHDRYRRQYHPCGSARPRSGQGGAYANR